MYARQCTRKLFNHAYISVIVLVVVVVMINDSDACPRRSPPARVPPPQRQQTTPRPPKNSPPTKTNPTGETTDHPNMRLYTYSIIFINGIARNNTTDSTVLFKPDNGLVYSIYK